MSRVHHPSSTGGWQFDNTDLSEYLDRYRNQRLVLIIAPAGAAEPDSYTFRICGFTINEVGCAWRTDTTRGRRGGVGVSGARHGQGAVAADGEAVARG